MSLIEHYELQVSLLKEKNSRLKDLLRKSRVELDKCNEYQNEITRLKEENKRLSLKLQIGDNRMSKEGLYNGDEIDEITMEEYRSTSSRSRGRQKDKTIESGEDRESEDFLSKMKKFNQLKNAEEVNNYNRAPVINVLSQEKRSYLLDDMSSFNIQAESTTIRRMDRSTSMQLLPSEPGSNGSSSNNCNNNEKTFFQGDISKMLSPMASSTACHISSGSSNRSSKSTMKRDWYRMQNAYGSGISSSSNSSDNSSQNAGQVSSIVRADDYSGAKKLFKFKPPSRNISSRSGIKAAGLDNVGGLRSKSELFRR